MTDNLRTRLLDLRPHKVHYILNTACYLACSHCSTNSRPGLKDENALNEFQRVLLTKMIGSAGASQLTITGGEPMMHKGLDDVIIEALATKRKDPRNVSNDNFIPHHRSGSINMQVSLHTTGWHIRERSMDRIQTWYDAGITEQERKLAKAEGRNPESNFIISLSLDSSDPEFNDKFRIKGYHKNTINVMEMLSERNLKFTVKTAVMKDNHHTITPMANILLPYQKACKHWLIQEVYSTGRATENWNEMDVPEGRMDFIENALEVMYGQQYNTANKASKIAPEKEGIVFSVARKEFHSPYPYFFIDPSGEVLTSDSEVGKEKSFGNIYNPDISAQEVEELRDMGYNGQNPIVFYWRRILREGKQIQEVKDRSSLTDSDTRKFEYIDQQSQNP